MARTLVLILFCALATTSNAAADASAQALELLQKSIAFRTVKGAGQVPAYASYLKGVLTDAGYAERDIRIEPVGETAFFVARYPGKNPSKKPIVLLGHMDVVEAKRADWDRDPFVPVIENGYVFGRGALDNKAEVSIMVATLAQLKREGWKPTRDVVLALTGDEETSMVTTHQLAPQLQNAQIVLNSDAGGGLLSDDGKPLVYALQAAEKTYADYELSTTDPGGHSSRPGKNNAIYRLAAALERIARYNFPVMQSEITSAYFKASAPIVPGAIGEAMQRYVANPMDADAIATLSADPQYVGQLRTTCVATMMSGGHAPNALPQRAAANINCRIFPGTKRKEVEETLHQIIADDAIAIRFVDNGTLEGVASPLRADVQNAVARAVHARYPGVPIVPAMSAGATDSMHFRALGIPSYGVAGIFMKASDNFAHGLNERLPVAAIDGAVRHWSSLLHSLAN